MKDTYRIQTSVESQDFFPKEYRLDQKNRAHITSTYNPLRFSQTGTKNGIREKTPRKGEIFPTREMGMRPVKCQEHQKKQPPPTLSPSPFPKISYEGMMFGVPAIGWDHDARGRTD